MAVISVFLMNDSCGMLLYYHLTLTDWSLYVGGGSLEEKDFNLVIFTQARLYKQALVRWRIYQFAEKKIALLASYKKIVSPLECM